MYGFMTINFLSDQISGASKNFIERVVSNWNANKFSRSVKISYLEHEESREGNKILDSADNLFQFFDLNTPWEVADVGMNCINDFISGKEDISNTLEIMDSARLKYLNS